MCAGFIMIWTGWNNSEHHSTGAGYGFKIESADRDLHFERSWRKVSIKLPTSGSFIIAVANVAKASFWNPACREVINKTIGRWMLDEGHAPWLDGAPPKFEVEPLGGGVFELKARTQTAPSTG
jgi:hypothetical protein